LTFIPGNQFQQEARLSWFSNVKIHPVEPTISTVTLLGCAIATLFGNMDFEHQLGGKIGSCDFLNKQV